MNEIELLEVVSRATSSSTGLWAQAISQSTARNAGCKLGDFVGRSEHNTNELNES